jgi:NAD(P)-dependent dehydrogenase (short-subunit alcohol dehydrogenase family)
MKQANWGRIINVARCTAGGLGAEVGLRRGQARHRRPDQGDGAGDRHHRHHLQRDLSRLGADAAGAEAGRRQGRALRISNEEAKKQLLAEKEPSLQFTTPEELGELAVFFCSDAGKNVRGVAWNMDGGWAAQ